MKVSVCCQMPVDEDIMICICCGEHLGDEDLEEEEESIDSSAPDVSDKS